MRVRGIALALAVALACASPTANASGDRAGAREQVHVGVAAAREGHWQDARAAFQRAYDMWPETTTLLNLASAEVQTGHFVKGAETYRKVIASPENDITPEQRSAAVSALSTIERKIAHLRVVVRAKRTDDRVEVDGTPAQTNTDVPVDPGPHVVRLVRDGAEVARTRPSLEEGQSTTVALEPPSPSPSGATPSPSASPSLSSEAPPKGGGILSSPWFWTGVGVIVVGSTLGILCLTTWCQKEEPHSGNLGSVTLP